MNEDCIFCKIVSGEAPAHKVWEDEEHLAFLSIFPNTPGTTVVITKEHNDSYIANLSDEVSSKLLSASKKVARIIDTAFDDVGRTGFVFEGFGVNHIHTKLFPMHGTKSDTWKQRVSKVDKFFDNYEGYLSSHDFKRASDEELSDIANKIRSAQK